VLDYYKIGQRIRSYRKILGISQDQLAEQVGISVTHMSHIETGNTKLSLTVFVAIAKALNVPADNILYAETDNRSALSGELAAILNNISPQQLRIITDVIRSLKNSLEQNI